MSLGSILTRVGATGKTRVGPLGIGCGVLCVVGLRPRDSSPSVAQSNHEGVGDVVWATMWGSVWAHVGLVMGTGGVLNHLITLGFKNEVVEHGLAAFGCFWHRLIGELGCNGFGWGWVKFGHGGGVVGLRGSGG